VAEALAHSFDVRAVGPLIKALLDTSAEVRFWAAFALGELGDESALVPSNIWPPMTMALSQGWVA